jgi:hypothetical protein
MRASSVLRVAALLTCLTSISLVHSALAGIPAACPACSTVPSTLTLGGQTGGIGDPNVDFAVVVRDFSNQPIVGSVVMLDFSNCAGVKICGAQPDPGIAVIQCSPPQLGKLTDVQGRVSFRIVGNSSGIPPGPCAQRGCVKVFADGVLIGDPSIATPDLDGMNGVSPVDLSIWLGLFFTGGSCAAADFNGSGAVDPADLSTWLHYYFAGGSVQSCLAATCP